MFIIGLLGLCLIALTWLLINQYKNDTAKKISTPKKQTETYSIELPKRQLIIDEELQTSKVNTAPIAQKIKSEKVFKPAAITPRTPQTEHSKPIKPLTEIKSEFPINKAPKPVPATAKISQEPVLKTDRQQAKSSGQTERKKTVDLKKLIELTFQQAQQHGNLTLKQEKLQQVLKLDNKHLPARLLLVETLKQQGLSQQSTYILDQGLKLFPTQHHLIQLRSQLYLQNNQSQQAIELLQKITNRKHHSESYLALLAAAYQQNQQYTDAQLLYQQLVRLRPQQAQYWLGLGLAHDNQGHEHAAVNAYQQALNKNTLQTAVVSYIKQRLSILK